MTRSQAFALLLVGALSATGAAGEAPADDCRALRDGAVLSDVTHPKFYVKVYEKSSGNKVHWIFEPAKPRKRGASETPGRESDSPIEEVDAIVDMDSRIYIEFRRDFIRCYADRFETDILVTASTKDGPVEVPGYAVVGEPFKKAPASVLTAEELVGLVIALDGFYKRFTLEPCRAYPDPLARLSSPLQRGILRHVLPARSAIASAVVALLEQDRFLTILSRRGGQSKTIIEGGLRRAREEYLPALGQPITPPERGGDDHQVVPPSDSEQAALAATRGLLDVLRMSSQLLRGLRESACNLTASPSKQLKKACEKYRDAVVAQREGASVRLPPSAEYHALDRAVKDMLVVDLLDMVRDTDILVSATKIAEGEELEITVEAGTEKEAARVLRIRVTAEELGVVRRITDSALFLKRFVDREDQDGDDDVALTPTPGVTLGWTYRARRGALLRFLNPGVGINVSFPAFAPTAQQTDPGASDAESGSRLHVAVGGVVSLFDNAVMVTYGWSLTARQNRTYWGLGFSFGRALTAAREAVE